MKKLTLFLGLVILIFTACSKMNDQVKPSVPGTLKTEIEPNTTWHDNGAQPGVEGEDYGCWGPPTNCLPEVTITITPSPDVLTGFISAVESADSRTINNYINQYYNDLSSYFSRDVLDRILNGTYTIVLRGSIANGTAYLVVLCGTTVIAVHPFV